MDTVVERFLRYTKIHTTSNPERLSFPSTERQLAFADKLVDELKQFGMEEVKRDKNGYVMATLPANIENDCPVVGFIAHMDTSPDFSGENVNPQIIRYRGGDIVLSNKIVLSPKQFPELDSYKGQELITTDGTTLLGADDKAGIAEIITAMEFLLQHPEIKHGKIRICMTPDEEIGEGASRFDVAGFGADFAYTVDGGQIGELEYENFNAAVANFSIQGRSVHPGNAKNVMINSIQVGHELNAMIPANQRPENTEGYEGYFHCLSFEGTVEKTKLTYLIRDHSKELFEQKKALLKHVCDTINLRYQEQIVQLEVNDQYYNMKEKIEPVKYILDIARESMEESGIQCIFRAIRGGTDGAGLSYMGLPCPNIFTGGHNFHGPYEYIPVESMNKAVEVIVRIAEKAVKKITN